jgi:rhodanese-related sulfurtransferase
VDADKKGDKMKKGFLILLIALISVMMVISCSKDDDDNNNVTESDFEVLVNYLNSNGMTIDELLSGAVITAATVHDNMADYYILDLRGADYSGNEIIDYDDGHIEGAVLTSSATIIDDAAAADGKPIVVVCWSGQSAGFNVMALRMNGYDARVLLFGMSGWHSEFDKWTGNCAQLDNANWLAAPGDIAEDMTYEMPDLVVSGDTGEEILAERIDAMLTGGFKGIKSINDGAGVLEVPGEFFINNYWAAEDVATYGNIIGAHRIKPLELTKLDPNETIVTYCWTSTNSSLISSYLVVLGYDAVSLKFGVNGIIYDDLTGHKWSGSADYDYVGMP